MTQAVAATEPTDVGAFDDFEHAVPKILNVNRRELVVYRWNDRIVALRNICAHQGMSFCGGLVYGRVYSEEYRGKVRYATEEPELVCPVHGYTFDADGQCTTHEHLRIKAYPVEIREGRVLIEVGS